MFGFQGGFFNISQTIFIVVLLFHHKYGFVVLGDKYQSSFIDLTRITGLLVGEKGLILQLLRGRTLFLRSGIFRGHLSTIMLFKCPNKVSSP